MGRRTSETKLLRRFYKVDIDGKGLIYFTDFVKVITKPMTKADKESELEKAFREFQTDGWGRFLEKELQVTLKSRGEELKDKEIKEMLQAPDTNGDGEIGE